jgi:hypothetical protein
VILTNLSFADISFTEPRNRLRREAKRGAYIRANHVGILRIRWSNSEPFSAHNIAVLEPRQAHQARH